jgi:hypothetical protein
MKWDKAGYLSDSLTLLHYSPISGPIPSTQSFNKADFTTLEVTECAVSHCF